MLDRNQYETTKQFFMALTELPQKGLEEFNLVKDFISANFKILLEQDEDGMTILHHIIKQELNLNVECTKVLKDLRPLMSNDFLKSALTVQDKRGCTPIHFASITSGNLVVFESSLPALLKWGYECGFDFSIRDYSGDTPLHHLVANRPDDRINMIEYLLKLVPNFDLNVQSTDGTTALMMCLLGFRLHEVDTLLAKGADPRLVKDTTYLLQAPPNLPLKIDAFFLVDHKIKLCKDEIAELSVKLPFSSNRNLGESANELKFFKKLQEINLERERQYLECVVNRLEQIKEIMEDITKQRNFSQ